MKTSNSLGVVALGSLLVANIVAPQVLSANDCCKYCGYNGYGTEATRWAESCSIYCCVSLCNNMDPNGSPNCEGGGYQCVDAFIDNCGSYVLCC